MADRPNPAPSPTETEVLKAIVKAQEAHAPVNPTHRQIAAFAGWDRSVITKAVRSLEAKKLIRRERTGGYRGWIRLTDRGQLVLMAAERRRAD